MADNVCPVCGANPCYRICPTQDPYQGDQAAEAADHDFNAQFDDHRERYAAEAADMELDAAAEEAWAASHPDEDYTDMRHGAADQYDDADEEYIAKGETGAARECRRAIIDSLDDNDIPF